MLLKAVAASGEQRNSVYFFTFDTLHEDLELAYRNVVGNHRVDTGV